MYLLGANFIGKLYKNYTYFKRVEKMKRFAQENGLTIHEVNLERNLTLTDIFESHDTEKILKELEYICRRGPINRDNSLLFLDEIQSIPVALQTLRYFYEDYPNLPVIAAGSLLEFALAKHSFSMPKQEPLKTLMQE